MKIDFTVDVLGYSVGGHRNEFDIEIEEQELEGMTIEEKYEYIDRAIYQYITDTLEIGYASFCSFKEFPKIKTGRITL